MDPSIRLRSPSGPRRCIRAAIALRMPLSIGRPSRCHAPEIPLIFRQYTARMSTGSTIPDSATVTVGPDVLGSELGSEVVMLSLRDGTYYGLDEVGAEIWRLIQGPMTIGMLVASLVETYDVDAPRCRTDVISLVTSLRDRGLVEVRDAV